MITSIPVVEMRHLTQSHRCGDCGGRLIMAWQGAPPPAWGQGQHMLRCARDSGHSTLAKIPNTKKVADARRGIVEVDIMTGQEVGTALAVPQTRAEMIGRAEQAIKANLWPSIMTPAVKALMVHTALAYGLDPLMGELVLYQGKPLVTINARRRRDAEAGHHPTIKFRFLTPEEKAGYVEAGAMEEGDLIQHGTIVTEYGNSFETIGKVTRKERKSGKQPVATDNPIEMAQKRCEARLRLMAYGPIPLPRGMAEAVLEQGQVVEGEILNEHEPEDRHDPYDPPPGESPDDPPILPLPQEVHSVNQFLGLLQDRGISKDQFELDFRQTVKATNLQAALEFLRESLMRY